MLTKIFNWIKENLLLTILLVAVAFLLFNNYNDRLVSRKTALYDEGASQLAIGGAPAKTESLLPPIGRNVAPTDQTDRLVIENTSLSLLVEDVPASLQQVKSITEQLGGFLVDSNLTKPEEAAYGQITVRVPSAKKDEALSAFKNLAVKTVSEYVSGVDVTDKYVDLEERLSLLNQTKAKFEAILNQAVTVEELLKVQRELITLQTQIDNLKGQQQYLEKSAELTKITVHLSTDEIALPYTPDESWRPKVIFKQAVRSMISSVRGLGSLIIWVVVYTPFWLPVIIIVYLVKRKQKSSQRTSIN